MKIIIMLLIVSLICSGFGVGFAQPVSLAPILETEASVVVEAGSIVDAMHQLVDKVKLEIPEIENIRYVYVGSQKFPVWKSHQIVMRDMKLRRMLDLIGAAYRHEVRYNFSESSIVFIAASGGEDYKRKYRFAEALSRRMKLDWGSEDDLTRSVLRHGALVDIEEVDINQRLIVLKGRMVDLDYFDMIVLTIGRKSEIPVSDSKSSGGATSNGQSQGAVPNRRSPQ